jgi:hypothetical protein
MSDGGTSMAEPTPPASLLVPALLRAVHAAGGFATVLAKGHEHGSALVLVHLLNHGESRAYERIAQLSGAPSWRLAAEGADAVDRFCERQRRFDPDLWIVELSVANPERFVPGFPSAD